MIDASTRSDPQSHMIKRKVRHRQVDRRGGREGRREERGPYRSAYDGPSCLHPLTAAAHDGLGRHVVRGANLQRQQQVEGSAGHVEGPHPATCA